MTSQLDNSTYVLTISEDDADEGRAVDRLRALLLGKNPSGHGIQAIEGDDADVAWFSLDIDGRDLGDVTAFVTSLDWIHPVEVLLRVKAASGGPDRFFSFDEIEGTWGWAPQS